MRAPRRAGDSLKAAWQHPGGVLARPLVCLAVVALAGCAAVTERDTPRSLARGNQSGIHDALQVVITAPGNWSTFWAGHVAGRTPAPGQPPVDFEKERIVAVYLGQKPNLCWAVEITEARTDNVAQETIVRYRVEEPTAGAQCAQAIAYPHHIVAIANAPTQVRFERVS